MSSSREKTQVKTIVMTAFFAAMIYLGIQSFRIPLPAAVGTPFVHFGHIFIMLSVVLLGTRGSMMAGVMGLLLFDVLNSYTHAIPNVFVSTLLNCFFAGTAFSLLRKRANGDGRKEFTAAVITAVVYGISNVVIDFLWSTCELVILGSALPAALTAELTAIPATIINAVFTVIGIAVLYIPVKGAYRRVMK